MRLDPEEVQEALEDPDQRSEQAYAKDGEQRWAITGKTEAGRILFVVFTLRNDKICVLSARLASRKERTRYEELRE